MENTNNQENLEVEVPESEKKPMNKWVKAALWTAGGIVLGAVGGALVGCLKSSDCSTDEELAIERFEEEDEYLSDNLSSEE